MRTSEFGEIAAASVASAPPVIDEIVRKVLRRLLPIAMLGMFASYLDRTNLAVVGSDMAATIGLTPSMFGLASGLFFIGYVVFEVPSNLLLQRLGAKIWLARIMVTWGLICMATALVTGATGLYVMRFLLGVGEAGFYPGIIFLLGMFVPLSYLARAYSIFQISITFSLALGSLVTTALLYMDGFWGLHGWQWVMIIEGGFAVVMGVVTFCMMSSSPETSKWLSSSEREILMERIRMERGTSAPASHGLGAMKATFKNAQVWFYSLNYMFMLVGFYAVIYWLPQIIQRRFEVSPIMAGALSAVPWVCATFLLIYIALRMVGVGRSFAGNAKPIVLILGAATAGLFIAAFSSNPYIAFAGLCLGACMQGAVPLFYTFPAAHFGRSAESAVALALVNSVGNIGGFFGPYLLGIAREWSGSDTIGICVLAVSLLIATVMAAALPRQLKKSQHAV